MSLEERRRVGHELHLDSLDHFALMSMSEASAGRFLSHRAEDIGRAEGVPNWLRTSPEHAAALRPSPMREADARAQFLADETASFDALVDLYDTGVPLRPGAVKINRPSADLDAEADVLGVELWELETPGDPLVALREAGVVLVGDGPRTYSDAEELSAPSPEQAMADAGVPIRGVRS